VGDRLLGEDADVERVVVAHDAAPARALFGQGRDTPGAEGPGDEAVEARTDVRVFLRAVELEETRDLVELVLDGVARDDLDVARDDVRGFVADGDAVPRVRAEEHA
jgi:hypothetical protein